MLSLKIVLIVECKPRRAILEEQLCWIVKLSREQQVMVVGRGGAPSHVWVLWDCVWCVVLGGCLEWREGCFSKVPWEVVQGWLFLEKISRE